MPSAVSISLVEKGLQLLERRGPILETARELSESMREESIPVVVIGGVAVVLHGHLRTTRDIDVFLDGPLELIARMLLAHGFSLDRSRREFIRDEIPVYLVTLEQLGTPPRRQVEIDGITTVSLEDLITMKLRSGTNHLLRAQDLADVIGLIRQHRLCGEFAEKLDKSVRPAFRKLIKAFKAESGGGPSSI